MKDFEAELGSWQNKDQLLKKGNVDKYRYQPGEAASDRPLNVQWIPIYKYANRGNVYKDEFGRQRRNPVVGRYAYWVDVENTKVNINVADRKFADSGLSAILGETEASNSKAGRNAFYFIQNPNVRDPSTGQAVQIRGQIEASLMNAASSNNARMGAPPGTVIDSAKVGRGDNRAAVTYYNLWMDWQDDGTPPYMADTSLIDWRVFTGLRPLAGGGGENITIEGLLADAAVDTDNGFNTFSEVFSLLDPKSEEASLEKGLTALTAMRRTYSNAATIYGWDEERDPLGRPKIDMVKLLNGGVGGPEFKDLESRLSDPDYYLAYHIGADPGRKSFVTGFNPLVGDNDPDNNKNGEAAVRQMLVNVLEYSKKHTEAPYIDEAKGIIGAKSMPYVVEVATRARNGFWRLYEPTKNQDRGDDDSDFDKMASDFATKVANLKQAVNNPILVKPGETIRKIDETLKEITNYRDDDGTFAARAGGKTIEEILTGVTVDLNAGMTNPNPFAEKTADPADPRNAWFKGVLKLNYQWEGVSPIEAAESDESEFEGLYVARSIPTVPNKFNDPRGIRVDGESVYFDLGMIPGNAMADPTKTTALRIDGWEIRRDNGSVFHKVPLRHLGQSSEARPWWAMAQADANPGIISTGDRNHSGTNRDSPDYFSLCHYYQPYNLENSNSGRPWQWLIPNVQINPRKKKPNPVSSQFPYAEWNNVSVGWFTARTMAEYCRRRGEKRL